MTPTDRQARLEEIRSDNAEIPEDDLDPADAAIRFLLSELEILQTNYDRAFHACDSHQEMMERLAKELVAAIARAEKAEAELAYFRVQMDSASHARWSG